jgi:hypothetical protein
MRSSRAPRRAASFAGSIVGKADGNELLDKEFPLISGNVGSLEEALIAYNFIEWIVTCVVGECRPRIYAAAMRL